MHTAMASAARKKQQQDRVMAPGWWLEALLYDLQQSEGRRLTRRRLAALCEVDKSTVQRWVVTSIPWLTWVGILHVLDRPRTWRPPAGMTAESLAALMTGEDEDDETTSDG